MRLGSMTTASWAKRPQALIGTGTCFEGSSANTSKTYPWSLSSPPVPALASLSSQVSQEPHGVGPPAQLLIVPDRPTHSERRLPLRVTSMTVQPPPRAPASYVVPSTSGTGSFAPGEASWFCTIR